MYVMAYFYDEDQAMHVAYGENLMKFTPLNQGKPVLDLRAQGKIIRDPYILQDKNGLYQLFFTDNWNSHTLGHSVSEDLLHWNNPEYLEVMGRNEDVANCWAPEVCYDEEQQAYMLFWSSSFYSRNNENKISNRIWYCHTKDFQEYTPAKLLFDPGYQVIDASILRWNGEYHMAFKDERGHNAIGTHYAAIRTAKSRQATGTYEGISELLTEFRSEGPFLIEEDGWIYLFYDAFGTHSYRGLRSKDMKNWEDITEQMKFPKNCKHLSILKVAERD